MASFMAAAGINDSLTGVVVVTEGVGLGEALPDNEASFKLVILACCCSGSDELPNRATATILAELAKVARKALGHVQKGRAPFLLLSACLSLKISHL